MKNYEKDSGERVHLLKKARLQILGLHKDLIDIERQAFEKEKGQLSSGQFLQILLNDADFSWLRKFSMLIVEIDEMFDLNDGYTEEMIENHLFRLKELLEFKTADEEFNLKFENSIQNDSNIETKHKELKKILAKE